MKLCFLTVFNRLLRETFVDITSALFEDRACIHDIFELLELLARRKLLVTAESSWRHFITIHSCFDFSCRLDELIIEYQIW